MRFAVIALLACQHYLAIALIRAATSAIAPTGYAVTAALAAGWRPVPAT